MWSPRGQQVTIPTPGQPDKYHGIGAVDYHTGETVAHFERRERRKEIAALLTALLTQHPTGTVYVAWDSAGTREDDAVEEVVRAAAGRLVLLYLPTYSPWLNPIAMLWRHLRREVTHCERFATKQALLAAAQGFSTRHNRQPHTILAVIGAKAINPIENLRRGLPLASGRGRRSNAPRREAMRRFWRQHRRKWDTPCR
jgi:transposase